MPNPLNPFNRIQFCPLCGVDSIERDNYRKDHLDQLNSDGRTKSSDRPEYVCLTCGFAFAIGESLRYRHATLYQQEHRQLRPSDE